MSKTGTYGLGASLRTQQASFGNSSVFATGADQSRVATGMLGESAERETKRDLRNQQMDQERKAGNSQLASTVASTIVGAQFGGWWGAAAGLVAGVAGYEF